MGFWKWVLIIGLVVGSIFMFQGRLNQQKALAFLQGKEIQELPNGSLLKVEKSEVFIVADDIVYRFKDDCGSFIDFFRKYPENMPKGVLKRCLIEET